MYLPSAAHDPDFAKKNGYVPLTTPYHLPAERKMLDDCQRQMKGRPYLLVGNPKAPEIWVKQPPSVTEVPPEPRGTSRPLTV